ncbi:uncharacterized protein LOC135226563 isoform X1 [Macrobrachium nipponense]|uniref:uncharacterized protein LOC135226563 isoform X1 n=1 Tax=Macrobrachium nipponense TaxID=159736 RepID=UPI0030C8356D
MVKIIFGWNGKKYTGIDRLHSRTKSTKTVTTSERRPGSTSTTYTHTYPGGSSSIITYQNTTTYSSRTPGYSRSTGQTGYETEFDSGSLGARTPERSSAGTRYETTYTRRYESGSGSSSGSSSSSSSYGSTTASRGRYGGDISIGEIDQWGSEEDVPTLEYNEEEHGFEIHTNLLSREDRTHPFVLQGLAAAPGYTHTAPHPCDQGSCIPATGNLLIGRQETNGLLHPLAASPEGNDTVLCPI